MELPTCRHFTNQQHGVVTISHMPTLRCSYCEIDDLRRASTKVLVWLTSMNNDPQAESNGKMNVHSRMAKELREAINGTVPPKREASQMAAYILRFIAGRHEKLATAFDSILISDHRILQDELETILVNGGPPSNTETR